MVGAFEEVAEVLEEPGWSLVEGAAVRFSGRAVDVVAVVRTFGMAPVLDDTGRLACCCISCIKCSCLDSGCGACFVGC